MKKRAGGHGLALIGHEKRERENHERHVSPKRLSCLQVVFQTFVEPYGCRSISDRRSSYRELSMAKTRGDQASKASELQRQADKLAAEAAALRAAAGEAETSEAQEPAPRRRRLTKGPHEPVELPSKTKGPDNELPKKIEEDTGSSTTASTKRRCKSDAEKAMEKMKAKKPSVTEQIAGLVQTCDFCLTWENLPKLMKHFGISEKDATAVLLELVGPNPHGKKFWDEFRVKAEPPPPAAESQEAFEFTQEELAEAIGVEDVEQEAKRQRLSQFFDPLAPEDAGELPDEFLEDPESECDDMEDGEPDDDLEGDVFAGLPLPKDDDNDSGSGGSAIRKEKKEMVCEKVGGDGEPPRESPMLPPPKLIARTDSLTPSEFRSLLSLSCDRVSCLSLRSCETLVMGQEEVSRQASHLGKTKDSMEKTPLQSDCDTEFLGEHVCLGFHARCYVRSGWDHRLQRSMTGHLAWRAWSCG